MNYAPHYVAVDLGETKEIHGWRVVSAEREAAGLLSPGIIACRGQMT